MVNTLEAGNILADFVQSIKDSELPIKALGMETCKYVFLCMEPIGDDWYRYNADNIVVFTEFNYTSNMILYGIDLSKVNPDTVILLTDDNLYGTNRAFAVNAMVNYVKQDIVGMSYDTTSLNNQLRNVVDNSTYLRHMYNNADTNVLGVHVVHKLTKCVCLIAFNRNDFGYVCIPDRIIQTNIGSIK